MANSWVLRLCPNPAARLRLFCFPSAGSGAAMYRAWAASFPKDVEVIGVHLPGRDALMQQPLQDCIPGISQVVQAGIEPYLDRPFAFFGHSMGAWIAFELTRALRRENKRLPIHFFASARRAPHIQKPQTLIHEFSDDDLVDAVMRRFGGIPALVLAEPDLMKRLLPALRADLKAIETYQYEQEPPLPCPISAFGGRDDSQVSISELETWGEQTKQTFKVQMFSGSHFYLNESSRELLWSAISKDLLNTLSVPSV